MSKRQMTISSTAEAVHAVEAGAAAIVLAYEWLKQYPDEVSEDQQQLLNMISAVVQNIVSRRFRPPPA